LVFVSRKGAKNCPFTQRTALPPFVVFPFWSFFASWRLCVSRSFNGRVQACHAKGAQSRPFSLGVLSVFASLCVPAALRSGFAGFPESVFVSRKGAKAQRAVLSPKEPPCRLLWLFLSGLSLRLGVFA
jgi:hypothetical protein